MKQFLLSQRHCVVILLVYCAIGIAFMDEDRKMEASTGIFMQPVENPLFYDTAVPMWFKFRFPIWERFDLILNETKCNSSDWFKGSSCPTMFYLPEVQRRFESFIYGSQPSTLKSSFPKPSFEIIIDSNCGKIRDRFEKENNSPISDKTLTDYISKFQNCSSALKGVPNFMRTTSDYVYDVKQVYFNMWSGFRKEVWAKLPADRIDGGMWSNAVTALNALIFLNFQMEINRWKFAADECYNGKIPSLVHPNEFSDLLHEVHTALEKTVYKPIIPVKCGIACHNSIGLSSCMFSETEFVVRILIPVTARVSRNLSLMKMTDAEFSLNGTNICKLPSGRNAFGLTLVDHDDNIAYNTDCLPGQLCHVPSQLSTENINVCVSATLQDGMYVEEFITQCPLSCRKTVSFLNSFPIVTFVEKNSVILTGTQNEPNTDVIITCVGKPESFVRPVSMGSQLIKLPCGCTIHSRSLSQNHNGDESASCSPEDELNLNITQSFTLTHIIPIHWIKNKDILKNLTIADLALLELNETNDVFNSETANTTFNDEEPDVQPEMGQDGNHTQNVENERNCENSNEETSFRTIVIIFCLSALLPTLLTIYLGYELRKLSEKVRLQQCGENSPILCQEFNTNQAPKPNGFNNATENEYEETEYGPIF